MGGLALMGDGRWAIDGSGPVGIWVFSAWLLLASCPLGRGPGSTGMKREWVGRTGGVLLGCYASDCVDLHGPARTITRVPRCPGARSHGCVWFVRLFWRGRLLRGPEIEHAALRGPQK